MWEQALPFKTQSVRKLKTGGCKPKVVEDKVTIPDAWNLNDAQRNFIELMFDNKK